MIRGGRHPVARGIPPEKFSRAKISRNPEASRPKLAPMVPMNSIRFAVLVAALAAPAHAFAQSSAAQAETLFRQGKDLIAHGKIAEACAAFDASQKLEPTLATLLNQASCREKNGQLATAWGLFLDAERQSRAGTDENTRQLHQVAADHAAKLEPRLSTLTINVPPDIRVAGLEVVRNADVVDAGAWNKALPVDGGTYKITARAPGNAEWASTITVGTERDAKSIDIPKLKAAALKPAPAGDKHPAPAPVVAEAHRSRVVPIVLGVAAVALGGGALALNASANSTYDKSKVEPNNATQDSLYNSANHKRYAAEGLAVAGVACAGVAIFMLVRGGGEPESAARDAQARLHVEPILGGDRAGLAVLGRF
jgi:hypothetical protein